MGKSENRWIRPVVVALSAGVHLFALHAFSFPEASAGPESPEIIELVTLPEDLKLEIKELEKLLKGQVVDLGPEDPNDRTPPPEDSSFLSERNMRTKRETVNPSRGRTGSPGARQAKKEESSKSNKLKGAISPSDNKGGSETWHRKGRGLPLEVAKADPEALTREDLMLSMADLQYALAGDNGSIDYVPSAVRGEFTSLNARKFAYAAFYNQIKKIIRFYWEPDRAISQIGWTGVTLETRLRVVVNADGTLDSVEPIKSSGYPMLDAVAIRAVRKAAPFYNVPPGLLNEAGQLDDVWAFFIVSE